MVEELEMTKKKKDDDYTLAEADTDNFYMTVQNLGEDAGLDIFVPPVEIYMQPNDLDKLSMALQKFRTNGTHTVEVETRNMGFIISKDEEDSTSKDVTVAMQTYRMHQHFYFEPEDFEAFAGVCQKAVKMLQKKGILKIRPKGKISFKGVVPE